MYHNVIEMILHIIYYKNVLLFRMNSVHNHANSYRLIWCNCDTSKHHLQGLHMVDVIDIYLAHMKVV